MEPGSYYHIYNRSINRERLFRDEENYHFFLHRYRDYLSSFVDTYAYCLMPTHFHFLIRIRDQGRNQKSGRLPISGGNPAGNITLLEKAFRDFFISYAKSYNNRYQRAGSLFQRKFRRKLANDTGYRMRLVVYIHANPVKAGLCTRMAEWKFSSYNAITALSPTAIQRESVLDWFGDRSAFHLFHQEYFDWEPD